MLGWFSFVAVIGCLMAIIKNIYVLSIGRFLYGYASGVFLAAGPRILNETIPNHLWDKGFGCSTNISVNFFIFIAMLLGIGSPTDPEELRETSYWKFVYELPIVFILIQFFLLTLVHKEDSLHFHIIKNEKNKAMKMI